MDEVTTLRQQLSASQAREQQLREKVHLALTVNYSREFADNRAAILQEAIALPTDTTALEAMIAEAKSEQSNFDNQLFAKEVERLVAKAGEVMRERCAVEAYEWAMAYVVEDTAPVGNADAIRALPGVTLEDLK